MVYPHGLHIWERFKYSSMHTCTQAMSSQNPTQTVKRTQADAHATPASMGQASSSAGVLVVYEEHVGSRTGASSRWFFEPQPITPPIFVGGGTHKKWLVTVLKGTKATLVRVSNRGNLSTVTFVIETPVFLDYLGGVSSLYEKYMRMMEEI